MTFIGFYATYNGDLIDPTHGRLIYKRMISKDLMRGLIAQEVPINDDGSETDQ